MPHSTKAQRSNCCLTAQRRTFGRGQRRLLPLKLGEQRGLLPLQCRRQQTLPHCITQQTPDHPPSPPAPAGVCRSARLPTLMAVHVAVLYAARRGAAEQRLRCLQLGQLHAQLLDQKLEAAAQAEPRIPERGAPCADPERSAPSDLERSCPDQTVPTFAQKALYMRRVLKCLRHFGSAFDGLGGRPDSSVGHVLRRAGGNARVDGHVRPTSAVPQLGWRQRGTAVRRSALHCGVQCGAGRTRSMESAAAYP